MATKMTFRHIGYYNDYEDVKKLFGRTATFVVQTMLDGLGAFHSVSGESETDIDDHKFETDADKFVKTENGNYLVRFERGSENGEGWFIDIYKLMEVEVEDTSDEDKDEEVYEYCPYCESEVKLDNEFKVQICPDCGHAIVPCSICPLESCCSTCALDVLCRQKNNEIEDESLIEVTLSSFLELFDKQTNPHKTAGYIISVPETENVRAHKLLFRYDFDYRIYILTNQTHNGQAYTWNELPSPGSLFDGLWNVSSEEMDSFKVKPNFK
jgi:hypothetical protein